MLTPESIQQYQAESNHRAGHCAHCNTPLHPFETHICEPCAINLCGDPNSEMREDEDDE